MLAPRVCTLVAAVALTTCPLAATDWSHGRIVVAPDGHHLQHTDGTPFFWLGDTAWELFHRLDRAEIAHYLDTRAAQGFTVIQAVALAEFDGLRRPNRDGEVPLLDLDPARPNEKYFALVDDVVAMARERGLVLGLLPTWGDKVAKSWGEGPEVFDAANAQVYGRWLGTRYRDAPNLVWILGGDRPPTNEEHDWRPVWRAMAAGLHAGAGPAALIAYHISGGQSSATVLHDEPWLDVNMMQSGHGNGHDVPVWDWITRDYARAPAKPVLDAEPNYEDHPVNPWPKWNPENGYFRAHAVRKQCYRSVFAGACGVTYGHHAVWQFWSPREEKVNHADRYWTAALDRPGAVQVGYLRRLLESRPFASTVPDQTLFAHGSAGAAGDHARALRATDGSFALIYIPVGRTVEISGAYTAAPELRASWFNPRDGTTTQPTVRPREARMSFTPPTVGGENDWVLILDDATAERKPPGTGTG